MKSELVQLLQNKLDDAVLDVISVMLGRNPLCKLLSEDVHFIQKPNQLPNNTVQVRLRRHIAVAVRFKVKRSCNVNFHAVVQRSSSSRRSSVHVTSIDSAKCTNVRVPSKILGF